MPHRDPQKRKEYHEIYARTDKGSASLKEGKRRYWEKLKSDPVRLDERRRRVREAMRLRRSHPERKSQEWAAQRERWKAKPKPVRPPKEKKDRKPMKPMDVHQERKKNWVSARHSSMFIENRNTVPRGRPRKKKTERPHCDHNQGFQFKMTEVGMRRTCNCCGRSFTEVAKR